MSRCNFDGWSDVIGEVPWCLSMQTTVRHGAELESDPLWHVQPVQFVVQECRQTTTKLPRVADYLLGGVTVRTLDLRSKGREFDSRPARHGYYLDG